MSGVLVLGATGNVGKHIVQALLDDPDDLIHVVAGTRDIESDGAKALLASCPASSAVSLLEVDMTMPAADVLAADLAGHSVIVLNMPQALAPKYMIQCQQTIAEAVAECMEQAKAYGGVIPLVVKLSSYGIDGKHDQGPLGEAHCIGEAAFRDKDIPLVSLRPTSFFSNFVAFDWPSLSAGGREISSPLGQEARVNWVACKDIGRVAAAVIKQHLQASQGGSKKPQSMFRVVDVVGPASNTLSAPDFCRLVGQCLGEGVTYKALDLPTQEDYRGLWSFLRAGGFDVQDPKAEAECQRLLGGRSLTEFRAFVTGLVKDMKEKQDKSK